MLTMWKWKCSRWVFPSNKGLNHLGYISFKINAKGLQNVSNYLIIMHRFILCRLVCFSWMKFHPWMSMCIHNGCNACTHSISILLGLTLQDFIISCRIYYVLGIWFNVNRVFTFLFSCKIYYVVGIWLNVNKVSMALCLWFSWKVWFWSFIFHIMKFQGTPNEQEASYFTFNICVSI
jgi:hypothetical protein